MRDPERIPEFLEELGKVWKLFPDWRFGQLMANLIGHHVDPFYIEDDKLLERIKTSVVHPEP